MSKILAPPGRQRQAFGQAAAVIAKTPAHARVALVGVPVVPPGYHRKIRALVFSILECPVNSLLGYLARFYVTPKGGGQTIPMR